MLDDAGIWKDDGYEHMNTRATSKERRPAEVATPGHLRRLYL